MQPNELRAVLSKTREVAIQPVHVEIPVTNQRTSSWRGRLGEIYCPSGLVKATVIEDGFPWVEKRQIAVCGDQTYEVKRKNGVLVEIDPKDVKEHGFKIQSVNKVMREGYPYPHSEVVSRAGKKYIRLITSRKAIFTSWGEYELEIAKREQAAQRERDSRDQLRNPQAELMGMTREELEEHFIGGKRRRVYLSADWYDLYKYDENGDYLRDEDGNKVEAESIGKLEITLDQAKKILSILTPAQKRKLKGK